MVILIVTLIIIAILITGYVLIAKRYNKKKFRLLYIEGLNYNRTGYHDDEDIHFYSVFWPWILLLLWYSKAGVPVHKVLMYITGHVIDGCLFLWDASVRIFFEIKYFIHRVNLYRKFKVW